MTGSYSPPITEPSEDLAPGQDKVNLYAYTGSSMYPTFRPSDFFEVVPLTAQPLKCGDVILFRIDSNPTPIVHRVVGLVSDGVLTKGDHHSQIDPWTVSYENILGRVVSIQRGNRTLPLINNHFRRARLLFQIARIVLHQVSVSHMGPTLWKIKKIAKQILFRCFQAQLNLKVVRYNHPGGAVMRLFSHKDLIGEYDFLANRWKIRGLYRFLIDESNL